MLQNLQKPAWLRYMPLIVLLLLDGWLLYSFTIVQAYPDHPADAALWIPLAAALLTGAYFFSSSPGILFNRGVSKASVNHINGNELLQDTHVLVKVLAGLTFLAAGFTWMLLMYRLDGFYITPDSYSYARVAEQPILSVDFWSSERPFTLPLLFKLFHISTGTLNDPAFVVSARAKVFTQFQALLSLFSFTLLGMCATTHMRRHSLKALILTLSVAFAMTLDVAQWNRMLLSESTSLSFSALLLSTWLLSLHTIKEWDAARPIFRILVPAFLILTAGLFSFTRDVNAYLLGMIAAVIFLALIFPKVRRLPAARMLFIVALSYAAISGLQISSQNQNERWLSPLANVISKRILTSEAARDFFIANGAPFDEIPPELLPAGCIEDCTAMHVFLRSNPFGQILLDWYRTEGKAVYIRYLIHDPIHAVSRPLQQLGVMISPDSTEYRMRVYADPSWIVHVRNTMLPRSVPFTIIWSLVLILSAGIILLRGGNEVLLLPAVLILLSYGLMFIIWHGDGIELERHATQISLQYKLSMWYATIFLADILFTRLEQARAQHIEI